MNFVDADSQFTIDPGFLDASTLWTVNNDIHALINNHSLTFGHGVFANHHHSFPFIIRRLTDQSRKQLIQNIFEACAKLFKSAPDLILFPGESTASHLVSELTRAFGGFPTGIMLSPAFRSYGRFELKMEIKALPENLDKSPLKVLFFDDSFTTGGMEAAAITTLLNTLSGRQKFSSTQWLTFVVVHRGIRPLPVGKASPPHHKIPSFDYSFESFVAVGPSPVANGSCCLCDALKNVTESVERSAASRIEIRELLTKMEQFFWPKSLENSSHFRSILTVNQTVDLLYLSSCHIYTVCDLYMDEDPLPDKAISLALFIAVNFSDVSSYLSRERIAHLLMLGNRVINDDISNTLCLLAVGALLPASILIDILPKYLVKLLNDNNPNAISALTALALSSLQVALSAHDKKRLAELRQRELVKNIRTCLTKQASLSSFDSRSLSLILRDIQIVSTPTSSDFVEAISKVSFLLEEGGHRFFLDNRIREVRRESLAQVLGELELVFFWMKKTAEFVSPTLLQKIERASSSIRETVSNGDVDLFKSQSVDFIDTFWKESMGPFSQFLYYPLELRELMRNLLPNIRLELRFPKDAIRILELPSRFNLWKVLGPVTEQLRDHFINSFINPFKYFDAEAKFESVEWKDFASIFSRAACAKDRPVLVIFFKEDITEQFFEIIFADRAKDPAHDKMFSGRGALSASRALANHYGGDIRYERNQSGLVKYGFESLLSDPSEYRNIFTTKFPLISI